MTPIKLNDFLTQTASNTVHRKLDLAALGLYHAAPRENGKPILAMRYDVDSKTLIPAI